MTLDYLEQILDLFLEQKRLSVQQTLSILKQGTGVFQQLKNVIDVDSGPNQQIIIVGDTHGQFYDVVNLIDMYGPPSENQIYLFNGDVVDRGSHGVENMLFLIGLKLVFPNYIHILRGNHESERCTQVYGFRFEVFDKYKDSVDSEEEVYHENEQIKENKSNIKIPFEKESDIKIDKECNDESQDKNVIDLMEIKTQDDDNVLLSQSNKDQNKVNAKQPYSEMKTGQLVYSAFLQLFNSLPIGAIVNKEIFVTHGGLFDRYGVTIDDIQKINRFCDPGQEGGENLMGQMMWADPSEFTSFHPSIRSYGCLFGEDVTDDFLINNNLKLVVRSHEQKKNGFQIHHSGKLITIFSAPSYCLDTNLGAVLLVTKDESQDETESQDEKEKQMNGET
ncbi:MAG: putative Serine/threonine-protein phosphatase 5 [Streblomastix strix]|uniref:Serine/threonine-protein phosphatase n=1 Tax=Streblomastix strix TaxID=222440 RepID=A0A5J4X524_9EUKA|nr:MAG: putative Serine/threonine-protein phosphatase 5 [Streblomastix strix]